MDLFVSGGTVVTMDAEFRVIEDGGVAIEGDLITEVGKRARPRTEIPRREKDD